MHIIYLTGEQQYRDNKFWRHVYDSEINKGLPVPFTCWSQYWRHKARLAAVQMQKAAFGTRSLFLISLADNSYRARVQLHFDISVIALV